MLGLLDYLTGPEIFVPTFYLIPVSLAAWFGGRWAGTWVAVVSTLTGLSIDLILRSPYSHPVIPYWNMLARLSLFLIVAYLLATLQAARQIREELQNFIVHDLGTPLSGIILALHALQVDAHEMNPTQQMLIKSAIASSQWMSGLVNSLLNLSRLESGRMPLQTSHIEVKDLIEASVEQVALRVEQHQLTVVTELATDKKCIYADRELTVRILVNLLGNAIKFSPRGSVITVRVALSRANRLAVSVTDQGPGIPKRWAGKVFDKFTQIEARQSGVAVGSGLGLTFCKLAVEAQGGHIWLESNPGQGTSVTFTLPIRMRPSPEPIKEI